VSHRDNLIAQTEREQQLGGVRNEAHDAHPVTVLPLLTDNEIQRRLAAPPAAVASSEGLTLTG
jgi:hypothetical protein